MHARTHPRTRVRVHTHTHTNEQETGVLTMGKIWKAGLLENVYAQITSDHLDFA